jgi:outer membrane protein OmpA-like peptidoglycan-associated protein
MFAFLVLALAVAAPPAEQDFDKDGIIDLEDDCPTDPGDASGKGCPGGQKPAPAPVEAAVEIEVKNDRLDIKDSIEFRSGSASVDPSSFGLLASIAKTILALPANKKIVIEGHTDDRGNKKKNEQLSEDRAKAVIAHLVRGGVARDRLSAIGYGPNRPIAPNKTDAGRKKNRRVEFLITDG